MLHLITGGGGYLGTHLAARLLRAGLAVRVFDLARARELPPGAEWSEGDVRDAAGLREAARGAAAVHHLAFIQAGSRKPEEQQRAVAIDGTRNALEAAAAAGARRFVFTGTIEIYGTRPPCPCPEDAPADPVGTYGRLKLEAERLAFERGRALGLDVVSLRMPTLCGPGYYNFRPFLTLLERARTGRRLAVLGDGSTLGDRVHVEDVCEAYYLAATRPAGDVAGEAFNVSSGTPASHLEIVRAIAGAAAGASRIARVPRFLGRALLPPLRWLGVTELPAVSEGYLFHDHVYATDKARRRMGYGPRHSAVDAARALASGYGREHEASWARAEAL